MVGIADNAEERPTFLDPRLQSSFVTAGFAVVPALPREVAKQLRHEYRALRPDDDHGLAIDYVRPDRGYMAQVKALTDPLWDRYLPALFVDHEVVMTTFVTKHPGPASTMFLHDDRSFVDERLHRAGTLWIPLVDVGPDLPNGGLQLVPGSHLLGDRFAGSNTPELFRPYERALRQALVTPSVAAGEAIFYDTRTLHASPPNLAAEPREAVVCAVVPRGAQLVHLVATGRRHRVLHQVDRQFFLDHHPRTIEREMPGNAPVVEEWDEDCALDPSAVGAFLGLEGPAPAEVVIPDDLQVPPGEARLEPGEWPQSAPVRRVDLRLRAGDLEPRPTPVPVPVPVSAAVGVVASALVSTDQMESAMAPRGDGVSWNQLVVVDPGGRATFDVPREMGDAWIDVIECARLAAGVAGAETSHQFDPGCTIVARAGTSAVMWNGGPGPLVVTISPMSGPVARGARKLGRRFLRRGAPRQPGRA